MSETISVKIDKEIHSFIKAMSKKTGIKLEKIYDDIIRPWYEQKLKEKKGGKN